MRFSMQLFEYEMGNLVAGSNIKSDSFQPKISYSYLLEPNEPHLYSEVLYVASADTLQSVSERINRHLCANPSLTFSCVCVGDLPGFLVEARNCDAIWVDASNSLAAVFNTIQKITRRFEIWEKQLSDIATSGRGINELVASSIPIFKNDICVTDHFSRVLAYQVYRSNRISREDSARIIPGSYLPKEMILDGIMDEIEGRGFLGAEKEGAVAGFSRMRAFDCTVLQYTINVRPEYSVILSVHSNYQEVGPHDCAAVLVLGEAIRRSTLNYGPAITNEYYANTHSTLKALLEGAAVSGALLSRCAATLQWNQENDEFAVFCITLEQNLLTPESALMRPYASICNHLQIRLDCPVFVVNDTIALVANLTQLSIDEEKLSRRLATVCREFHLIAGASGVYRGAHSLTGCYQRAHEAMRSLAVIPSDNPVLYFSERAVAIAMSIIADRVSPEQFCSRQVLNLARRDPKLYETLEAYLRQNCNANEASKALGVQRSTFIYRLDKVCELIDIDFDNYDERLLLMISCRLIEMFGIDKLMSE